MKVAIYPGSFDPFTNGHKNILEQASKIFDLVIIAIAEDNYKKSLFSTEERKAIIEKSTKDIQGIEIVVFQGLLADFVCERRANAIIRGLRMVSDFEYEMQMAAFNKKLCPSVETVFFTSEPDNCFISSSFVRNIAVLGGDVNPFVSEYTEKMLRKKFEENL